MRQFLPVFLILTSLTISFVNCDEIIQSSYKDEETEIADKEINSVKTKRGIYNYAIPYGPYAKFPGIYKGFNSPGYTLTPGNAVIHSYNVNYPKIYVPKPAFRPSIPPPPLLVHPKPILPVHSIPIYAKRFPVFVQKSVLVHRPVIQTPFVQQFTVPPFVPAAPHFHPSNPIPISNAIPQSTLISQDGWKPVSTPAVTVLPPFSASPSPSHLTGPNIGHTPSNYYLPPVESQPQNGLSHANEQYHQQHELQAHLQHLQHIQQIQNNGNFLRNDETITPLSEQGYETASNNGRYSGPSSYEVQLSSRG